ncbi:hypothetical protein QQX98_009965 [Neonectria punicea]|uniref:Uncharacterized protein n=1 Tax=Neonectria punicea TaxID=979145 RepID=A0ABR1GQQ2_9HYPO
MLPLSLLLLATLVRAADKNGFTTPVVVEAGDPFTIFINLSSASSDSADCQGPERCDMKYMRIYLMGDPTHDTKTDRTGELIIWRQYCYLEGCVSTDLTSFNTTIPKASFPDGYPYSLDYNFFTPLDNGTTVTHQPTFSIFSATTFNLTGATGNWSEFAYELADYGIEKYVYDVPCSAVPCLQECQTEWVTPYVPVPRRKGSEMDACVELCKVDSDPMDECLTRNATTMVETATATAAATTTTDVQASETSAKANSDYQRQVFTTKPRYF